MQQRAPYSGPAKSPELFHPRPQHISQVPHLRSPPPPAGQQQPGQPQVNSYGNPYQQSPPAQSNMAGGGQFGNQFNNFMSDPTTQMSFQIGASAVHAGQQYIDQNLNRWFPNILAAKHYFDVSNSYVVRKLLLVLFPWRHKPWTRQQSRNAATDANGNISSQPIPGGMTYLPPRDDLNSPDMYIPTMSLITYTLLSTFLAGIRGSFRPELLGSNASTAVGVIIGEYLILKLAMYFLSINNESSFLDLLAYSGYKFVGVIVTLFLSEILTGGQGTGNWIGWTLFVYLWLANAFFLVCQQQPSIHLFSFLLSTDRESSFDPSATSSYQTHPPTRHYDPVHHSQSLVHKSIDEHTSSPSTHTSFS